jgi:ribose/xylose/arabinose/galactoside ABC-type transport system permease subunit
VGRERAAGRIALAADQGRRFLGRFRSIADGCISVPSGRFGAAKTARPPTNRRELFPRLTTSANGNRRKVRCLMVRMFGRLLTPGLPILMLCVVYAAGMALAAPSFATGNNFANILAAMLPLLVVATGQTVVLITGGIDLSVTSTIAVTSIAGAALVTADGGPMAQSVLAVPAAIVLMILIGGAIGLVNGGCVAWLGMPPFIVTLTTMMFFGGLAVWLTGSRSFYNLPPGFVAIGGNLAATLVVAAGVAAAVQWMLSRTVFGLALRAVGGNIETARVSGVAVGRTIVLAYLLCGICAGVGSVLITGELETGSPVQWENNLLDVIGATVIGGTSLYGGRGSVLWTLGGVLLLTMIDNSLNLLNLSHFTIMMAKGGVILLAAMLDALRHRADASS